MRDDGRQLSLEWILTHRLFARIDSRSTAEQGEREKSVFIQELWWTSRWARLESNYFQSECSSPFFSFPTNTRHTHHNLNGPLLHIANRIRSVLDILVIRLLGTYLLSQATSNILYANVLFRPSRIALVSWVVQLIQELTRKIQY